MRGFYIPVTMLLLVCGCASVTRALGADDSKNLLRWAPLYLKSPYLTFINKFYYPSWLTRNPITKEEESLRYLQLPRGVPFAVVCGACFQKSRVTTNLTVSVTGHAYHSVPKKHSNNRQTEYHVGYNECLMTYMITDPIEKSGTITCTLDRGKQRKTEVISFSVTDVDIEEPPEELKIQNDKKEVTLHCPTPDETPSSDNPHVYVWHEDHSVYQSASSQVIAEMRSIISLLRRRHTRHVVCSVYSIVNPTKVYRKRYQIIGSQARAKQEYQISSNIPSQEDDTEELTAKIRLPNSVLGIIVTAAVICVLLLVTGVYRFIAAARRE